MFAHLLHYVMRAPGFRTEERAGRHFSPYQQQYAMAFFFDSSALLI